MSDRLKFKTENKKNPNIMIAKRFQKFLITLKKRSNLKKSREYYIITNGQQDNRKRVKIAKSLGLYPHTTYLVRWFKDETAVITCKGRKDKREDTSLLDNYVYHELVTAITIMKCMYHNDYKTTANTLHLVLDKIYKKL